MGKKKNMIGRGRWNVSVVSAWCPKSFMWFISHLSSLIIFISATSTPFNSCHCFIIYSWNRYQPQMQHSYLVFRISPFQFRNIQSVDTWYLFRIPELGSIDFVLFCFSTRGLHPRSILPMSKKRKRKRKRKEKKTKFTSSRLSRIVQMDHFWQLPSKVPISHPWRHDSPIVWYSSSRWPDHYPTER